MKSCLQFRSRPMLKYLPYSCYKFFVSSSPSSPQLFCCDHILSLLFNMKIPTSSSILLATLAMSSSSSSLIAAAPSGNSSSYTGMTSSASNNHVSSLHEATAYLTELDMQGTSERAVSHCRSCLTRSLWGIQPDSYQQVV